jgi:hypothetical protein
MAEISFPNGVANTKKMFIRITATITAGAAQVPTVSKELEKRVQRGIKIDPMRALLKRS